MYGMCLNASTSCVQARVSLQSPDPVAVVVASLNVCQTREHVCRFVRPVATSAHTKKQTSRACVRQFFSVQHKQPHNTAAMLRATATAILLQHNVVSTQRHTTSFKRARARFYPQLSAPSGAAHVWCYGGMLLYACA